MSLLSRIFVRNKPEKEEIYQFKDEDRKRSLERRQINHELRKTEEQIKIEEAKLRLREVQERLSEYDQDEEEEEDDMSIDKMFASALLPLITINQSNPPQVQQEVILPSKIDLSDETIEGIYNQFKHYMKFAKKMKDEEIRQFLLSKEPALSDDSIARIILRVRR